MARKAKNVEQSSPSAPSEVALGRIARLLGLIATKDMPRVEQVGRLSAVGFENTEIADILGITPNNVGVALHGYKRQSAFAPKRKKRER